MPLFIAFEGLDGGGKSTQARLLAEALRRRGYAVTETREPGGTALGEGIRGLLLESDAPPATPLAAAFLLSAARAQLVSEVIGPALARGEVVIADRFADSTVAYQAFGYGLGRESMDRLVAIATGGLRPDVVVYVDIEPEVGLQRVQARGAGNRFDATGLAFYRRVHRGYRHLAALEPDRWVTVDGAGAPESVHSAVLRALEPILTRVAEAV
ncbi:MAG: dTMP kinase [Chloroflexi bacterium]|nr:dTMP kinase [Chloroflexota bacterium]